MTRAFACIMPPNRRRKRGGESRFFRRCSCRTSFNPPRLLAAPPLEPRRRCSTQRPTIHQAAATPSGPRPSRHRSRVAGRASRLDRPPPPSTCPPHILLRRAEGFPHTKPAAEVANPSRSRLRHWLAPSRAPIYRDGVRSPYASPSFVVRKTSPEGGG